MSSLNNLDANQVTKSAYDNDLNAIRVYGIDALAPIGWDNLLIGYISGGNGDGEIGTVIYKAGSDTLRTLTLTYDGSNRLSTVTVS